MIREVHLDHSTWNDLPYKFEAGTMNIAQAIGLGSAVDYLNNLGMDKVREHEKQLGEYAYQRLSGSRGHNALRPREGSYGHRLVLAAGRTSARPRSASGRGRHRHKERTPLYPASDAPSWHRCHVEGLYLYNTEKEVDTLVGAIVRAREFFGAFAR